MFAAIKNATSPEKLQKIIIITILVTVVIILILVFWGIYELAALFLPSLISLLIVFYLVRRLAILLCRFIIFPGSFWFIRRNMENTFSRAISNKSLIRMKQLIEVIEYILNLNNNLPRTLQKEELMEIHKMIDSYIHTFKTMVEQKTINRSQRELLDSFLHLQSVMKETRLKAKNNPLESSLWELMENSASFLLLIKDQVTRIEFEYLKQGETLLQCCKKLEGCFNELVQPKPFVPKLRRWLFNNTLGSIDQMRVELENRFKTKRIWLKTSDKRTLDCIFILANVNEIKQRMMQNSSNDPNNDSLKIDLSIENIESTRDFSDIGPVVIFCNPNAGYYEYMYYESEWIEFYTRFGINLFLWNYSGYGNSSGSPDPHKCERDGELIIEHLRKEMKIKTIGIHGESLGGFVATHLASEKKLDFLCADRTFSSFSEVAKYGFGRVFPIIFRCIVNWNKDSSKKFSEATCYKVVTFDSKDEIIPLLASLQNGVLRSFFMRKYNVKLKNADSYWLKSNLDKRGIPFKALKTVTKPFLDFIYDLQNDKMVDKLMEQGFEETYLSRTEYLELFSALKRVIAIVVEMSKFNKSSKKFHKKSQSMDDSFLDRMQPKNTVVARTHISTGSLESSLNVSSFRDESLNESNIIANNRSIVHKEDPSVFLNNTQDVIFAEFERSERTKRSDERRGLLTPEEDYFDLLTDKEKNTEEFQGFIFEVFTLLDNLDAAGFTINDVFLNYHKKNIDILKVFVLSLEVWGSYLPIKMIAKRKMTLPMNQKLALSKLKEFLNKLDKNISNQQKKKNIEVVHQKMIKDLEAIYIHMAKLQDRIQSSYLKYRNGKIGVNIGNTSSDGKVEIEMTMTSVGGNERRDLMLGNDQSQLGTNNSENDPAVICGNLLPLTCGHNGCFNKREIQTYEFHLRNAGFII